MKNETENMPYLLKKLRGTLRDGDIGTLSERTGMSRQTIHKLLKGEGITDNTRVLIEAAKKLLEEHHKEEKKLISKI